MNDTPTTRQSAHEELRESLIATILSGIEERVVAVIPPEVSREAKTAILMEVLPNARFTLEALSTQHLQSDRAIDRYIDDAVALAEYFVDRIKEKAIKVTESVCRDCDGTGSFDLFDDLPCERCGGTGIVIVSA